MPPSPGPAPALSEPEVRRQNLEDLTEELAAAHARYLRVVAGFSALHLGYLTFKQQLPRGERARGLPFLSFAATATGHDTHTVTLDLAKLPPDAVPAVLLPLTGLCYGAVLEAVADLESAVAGIRHCLAAVLAAPAVVDVPGPPAEVQS